MLKGLDIGVDFSFHTDILNTESGVSSDNPYSNSYSRKNEEKFESYWLDLKYQFTNHERKPGKLIFGLGLMYGHINYSDGIDIYSLPFFFGIPIGNNFLIQSSLKLEVIDTGSNAIESYMRGIISIGLEAYLIKNEATKSGMKFTTNAGIALGMGGSPIFFNASALWFCNFGLVIDLPAFHI